MSTSTAKRIQFNKADKDYSAYYDGELIGTFATYHQAEIELDAHALDLLERGLLDTTEGITTMQWQGAPEPALNALPEGHRRAGDDEPGWWYRLGMGLQVWITDAPESTVVYARPAEVVELLRSDDQAPDPNDTPPPGGPGEAPGNPSDGRAGKLWYEQPYSPSLTQAIALGLTGTANPVCCMCSAPAFVWCDGDMFCQSWWQTGQCTLAPSCVFCANGDVPDQGQHWFTSPSGRNTKPYPCTALPAASPAVNDNARTPNSSDGLGTPTGGREEPPPYHCHVCGEPTSNPHGWCGCDYILGEEQPPPLTPTVSPDPAATTAALVPLLRAALDEWIALGEQGITTPYDAALVQLARAIAPPVPRTLDHICGEVLCYEYCKTPGAFLEKFDGFDAPRQAAVTHAVATWLGVTVSEVDRLWLESRLRLGNDNAAQA